MLTTPCLALFAGLLAPAAQGAGPAAPGAGPATAAPLQRADVVFMGAKEPAIYQAYGATMVSWGGQAGKDDPASLAEFAATRIQPAHALGMRYCVGLAFRTAFARMIDFDPKFEESITRDLDGQPILVPWLWDHQHKGHGAYWFCTHAPGYQAYLRNQVQRAVTGDPDGLHIDDYAGTSGCPGGCFCRWCMADFTAWLREHASADELRAAGVASLDGFDYAAFLRARGVTAEQVRKERWKLPLNGQYETFQLLTNREFVASIRRYAEELRGAPLLMSVNSSALSAGSLVIAPVIDYFCGEVAHRADTERVPDEPIFVYKLADALGKGVACTADGWDWAYVMEKNRPGLVRTWIAQGYAFGHSLMAPHRQWAYTKEKGTHWYQSQPSDYAPLYQFVRANRERFDGYDAVGGEVAVVVSTPRLRAWQREAVQVAGWLARRNVPFTIVLAGDDWVDARLTDEALAGFQAVLAPANPRLDAAQEAVLDRLGPRLVTWPDKPDEAAFETLGAKLDALAKPPITCSAPQVTVAPRVREGAPAVLHLLNTRYDGATDGMTPVPELSVRVAGSLFAGRRFTQAVVHAPGEEPRPAAVTAEAGGVRVDVGTLNLWAVVELR